MHFDHRKQAHPCLGHLSRLRSGLRSSVLYGTTLALIGVLAACAAPPKDDVVQPTDPVRNSLEQSLRRVDAMPAYTSSGDATASAPNPTIKGSLLSISYQGDAHKLLARVAKEQGKEYIVRGPRPYLPLFVVLEVKNKSLTEVLTDVGAQFGQRADLALTNSAIEVRYRGQE